jgi:hypothetical protein
VEEVGVWGYEVIWAWWVVVVVAVEEGSGWEEMAKLE